MASLQGLAVQTLADERAYDAGIKNLGQTCYFNALLTCLSSATPFVHHLWQHLHQHSHSGSNSRCLRCRLARDLAQLCEAGRRRAFTPETPQHFDEWAPHFRLGAQQCVGEASNCLLDTVAMEDLNSVVHLATPAEVTDLGRSTVAAEHFQVAWTQARCCLNGACADAHVVEADNLGFSVGVAP